MTQREIERNKSQEGEMLYDKLLNEVHKGNFDEMYKYFLKNVERLKIYGITEEKQVLNYCTFQRDAVLNMYRVRR